MKRGILHGFWAGLFLAGAYLQGSSALAQEVVAVLSSDSPAYREALAGFEEGYGHSVRTFTLSKGDLQLPDSTKVVVAFGGKAATYHYPDDTTLVYCLTPAAWVGPEQHSGRRVRIYVAPPPDAFLSKLMEIQPHLRRLVVLNVTKTPGIANYLQGSCARPARTASKLQIEYLSRADDLPDLLGLWPVRSMPCGCLRTRSSMTPARVCDGEGIRTFQ